MNLAKSPAQGNDQKSESERTKSESNSKHQTKIPDPSVISATAPRHSVCSLFSRRMREGPGESPMHPRPGPFERFAHWATYWTGSSWAFTLAVVAIFLWLFTWPLFQSLDTWQLVINTATTIITFLMVFLIQHSQNKELMAQQIKLNELLAAERGQQPADQHRGPQRARGAGPP